MTVRNLDGLLTPRSVALIGASTRPHSLGAALLSNLTSGGFTGPVMAVSPRPGICAGVEWTSSIADLKTTPDLAVIATPASTVPDIIADLGAAGTKAAIVVTAGVDQSSGLRQAMLDAARPHLLRIVGPNCLGALMPHSGLNASFAHMNAQAGRLTFLSQSGALVTAILDWASGRGIGFSGVVSLGDMADVDMGDLIDLFAADPNTDAILLYIEGITNPAKFISAARAATRIKPVIAIKAGRNSAGSRAAASHTGAMTGSYDVYQAVFRRAGIVAVETLTELFDAAAVITKARTLRGDRLAIVTNGGGAGVLAADALEGSRGRLAAFTKTTLAKLDEALPPIWSHGNPIDIIGDAPPERYEAAIDAALADDGVDALLVMNCPTALATPEDVTRAVVSRLAASQDGDAAKPVIACWLGHANTEAARPLFSRVDVPVFDTPDAAIQAFGHLVAARRARAELLRAPSARPEIERNAPAAQAILDRARDEGRHLLNEVEAKELLSAYGIRTVPTRLAATVEDVALACRQFPGPYALKIVSPEITHKSDVGGVVLNLADGKAVTAAAQAMAERIGREQPNATITGFSVQPMISYVHAHELIVGISEDATFGPVLMVGAGGKAVEILHDRALGLPPLDTDLAQAMIGETRISALLHGYRDEPPADLEAVSTTLIALSRMTIDLPDICELDINPLLVGATGAIALDARIRIAAERRAASRLVIRPMPENWSRTLETRTGRHFHVRPVQPADEDRLTRFFDALSPADRRFRFLSTIREVGRTRIAVLTQIDYRRAMNFLGLDENGAVIGTAMLAADPDFDRAEIAIAVHPDQNGQGIGWALMQHLIAYAAAEGIGRLEGLVDIDNNRMIQLARDLGMTVEATPGRDTTVTVVKILSHTGAGA